MHDPVREVVYLWPENLCDTQKDIPRVKKLKGPLKMEGTEVGGLARHCCRSRQRESTFQGHR